MFRMIFQLCAILVLTQLVDAHITLTFPQARFPPLDFLDTARTIGPCGVPKSDKSHYSMMQTRIPYNVTWRLQYPHQGGFRLYVIDYAGNIIEQLAPDKPVSDEIASTFDGLDDQSAEWRQVKFNTACPNCTLVLERQALEWGPSYKFRSCAEIHVAENIEDDRLCMNKGALIDGECKCREGFSGKQCQYKDDCTGNEDCTNGGKCMPDAIFPNKRSCFCKYGFFGPSCKEESAAAFAEDECFRHLGNNSSPATFKYGMFEEKCFKKFDLGNGDLIYSRTVKDQVEIIMDYETESYAAIGWRPQQIPKTCRLFPDLSKGNDPRQGGKTSGYLQSTLDSALHPMDCTDVIMASVVHGDFLHIEDMYTRDRSTPLIDDLLDGEQSLTAAYGIERNGRTIVMFRRGIREIEPSDHPLGPGKLFVIHAKGQKQGSYKHTAPSALEKKQTSKPDFYRNDQWRYHGAENRGVQVLEFVSAVEMRFKGPLMHREENSDSSTSTIEKVISRPEIQFREQVLPRPEDSASTSSAPTSLSPPQTLQTEPTPEPEPQPSIRILHRSKEESLENSSDSVDSAEEKANNARERWISMFMIVLASVLVNRL